MLRKYRNLHPAIHFTLIIIAFALMMLIVNMPNVFSKFTIVIFFFDIVFLLFEIFFGFKVNVNPLELDKPLVLKALEAEKIKEKLISDKFIANSISDDDVFFKLNNKVLHTIIFYNHFGDKKYIPTKKDVVSVKPQAKKEIIIFVLPNKFKAKKACRIFSSITDDGLNLFVSLDEYLRVYIKLGEYEEVFMDIYEKYFKKIESN